MKTGFFKSLKNTIGSIVIWFAGFFEDSKKSASSKRAIVYVATYLLCVIVFAVKDGKWQSNSINSQIFWGVTIIVLFGIDAIRREQVSKIIDAKFNPGKDDPTT